MKNMKGYSIIELLITLFIVALIISAAYYTYVEIFRGMKEESESTELQMEKIVGLELLRLDLEHIGYGIAKNVTDRIIEYNNTTNELIIRSTLNNTNKSTMGWVLCVSGNKIADHRGDQNNNRIVYIDVDTGNYNSVVNDGSCPSTGIEIGFPISSNANACAVGTTNTCNTIRYRLSTTTPNPLSHCNPNTSNLLRVVNNSPTGNPVLECVADFKVTFDLDTDNDGDIDCNTSSNSCSLPSSNGELRQQVKKINVYILMQEGGLNKNYVYPGGNPIIDGITLQLPSNYQHYRWKVIKISVKPLGMFGGITFK